MSLNSFLTCPADCDTALNLGALPVNQDCTTYTQQYSQIKNLIIQPAAANAALDWSSAPTVTAAVGEIDNSDSTGAKSKILIGEGEIQAPEKQVDEYPNRKTRVNFRTYTLTHTIKQLDADTYSFLRQLQCGDTDFTFYYDTVGGRLFGGSGGIEPKSIDVDLIYSGGREDKESANIIITWEADGEPDRGTALDTYQVSA